MTKPENDDDEFFSELRGRATLPPASQVTLDAIGTARVNLVHAAIELDELELVIPEHVLVDEEEGPTFGAATAYLRKAGEALGVEHLFEHFDIGGGLSTDTSRLIFLANTRFALYPALDGRWSCVPRSEIESLIDPHHPAWQPTARKAIDYQINEMGARDGHD